MAKPPAPALGLSALLLLSGSALAQTSPACDWSEIFDASAVKAECPADRNELEITLKLSKDASTKEKLTERLKSKLGEAQVLVQDLRGTGAGPRVLASSAVDSILRGTKAKIVKIVVPSEPNRTYHSVSVVLPPDSLICGGAVHPSEVTVPLLLFESAEQTNKLSCRGGADEGVQGKALGWRIDLSPIDNANGNESEAAIDFILDKTWGFDYKPANDYLSWSEKTWKLKLDGALSTDENTFYNSVRGEAAWSYKKFKLGKKATGSAFPVYWLSAYVGSESSHDLDNRDIVFGARAETLLNVGNIARSLIPGIRSMASIRPFVSLGVETVEPDERDDGKEPASYERLTGKVWWKLPVTGRVYLELKWEALYLLDDEDADRLTIDRFSDRLDIGVSLAMGDSDDFRPFLKWTKGEKGPVFDEVEEYLLGMLWEFGGAGKSPQ